jgi:hypothetical protein
MPDNQAHKSVKPAVQTPRQSENIFDREGVAWRTKFISLFWGVARNLFLVCAYGEGFDF